MIEESPFQLRTKTGLAGQPQQLRIQLNPGRRDARLGLVRVRVIRKVVIFAEMLSLTRTPGEIQPMRHNVFPGQQNGLQQFAIAAGSRQFAQADQIRQHFVSFGIGRQIDLFLLEQCGNDLRTSRFVPRLHQIPSELQVALVARVSIQQHDWFQHAGRRHPDVCPRVDDALLSRSRTKRLDQQVADLPTRIQCGRITGEAVVREQTHQTVLVRPDIPIRFRIEAEAFVRRVGPQVTVGFLRLDQFLGGVIQFLAERLVSRVGPSQCGRMHPLPNMFADPRVRTRFLAIAGQQRLQIDLGQAVFFIESHAMAEPTAELNCGGRKFLQRVGQLGIHLIRDR